MRLGHIELAVVLLAGLVVLTAWLLRRRGWLGGTPRTRFLPVNTPRPSVPARRTEAAMLVLLSLASVAMMTCPLFQGDHLLLLGSRLPHTGNLGWVLAGVAAILALLCALPALRGWTKLSLILGTLLVIGYGYIMADPVGTIGRVLPLNLALSRFRYEIRVTDGGVEIPAEVWVNGVYLGTAPVRMGLNEFYDRVPFWANKPTQKPEDTIARVFYSPTNTYTDATESSWIQLSVPPRSTSSLAMWATSTTFFYAKVRYAGQWGARQGNADDRSNDRATSGVSVRFPDKHALTRPLLNHARANDYKVGPKWFAAYDTLGELGRDTIYNASATEPEMARLADDWVSWRYGLDKATTSEAAWQAFRRICDQADREHFYCTDSISGRAVELLLPKLDPERLVGLAEDMIATTGGWSYSSTTHNGRFTFGVVNYDYCSRYAVAHAIWLLDQKLDAEAASSVAATGSKPPNLVEKRIPLALLQRQYRNESVLQTAADLGGCPELDKFLSRQPYDAKVSAHGFDVNSRYVSGGVYVNKWLYLLANLNTPGGRTFRQRHMSEVMELADTILKDSHSSEVPDFLFLDLDLGKNSLAALYWPQFVGQGSSFKYWDLPRRFKYLERMGKISTVEMYVEAWRSVHTQSGMFASHVHELSSLPLAKRKQVVDALTAEVNQDMSNVQTDGSSAKQMKEQILAGLKSAMTLTDQPKETPESLLRSLLSNITKYRQPMIDWLIHEEPNHPVIKLLAESDKPEVRSMVPEVVRTHPTPANRATLARLLADADPAIATAARKVQAEIDALAATPPAQLLAATQPASQPK